MKPSISPQERLLLAAIILSGLCANSCYPYSHFFHMKTSVSLLDKHFKETGKTGLGREVGYKKPREAYEEAYKDVIKLLRRRYPIRKTAKLADVSESTVKRVKAEQMHIFEKGFDG